MKPRVYLFIPSKNRGSKSSPNYDPWIVVWDESGVRCDCPGFKHYGYCHHQKEVQAGRESVSGLSALQKAALLEMFHKHPEQAYFIAKGLFPSATKQEIKTHLQILIDAFNEHGEAIL